MKFGWDVAPPDLPKGATERLQQVEREEPGKDGKPKKASARIPHDPRVFDHGEKVYVLLGSVADADRVRNVAKSLGATVVLR